MHRIAAAALAALFVALLLLITPATPSRALPPGCIITVNAADHNLDIDASVSLREAISFAVDDFEPQVAGEFDQIANCPDDDNNPGAGRPDTIVFDPVVFPSGAPVTINLTTNLPKLHTGEDIVDGVGAGVIVDGGGNTCFTINSSNNAIFGLQIRGCAIAVLIEEPPPVPLAQPQGGPTGENLIEGNVIGANTLGIQITGSTSENRIERNLIGTDPTGTVADANNVGVMLLNAAPNIIGGPGGVSLPLASPAGAPVIQEGNLISGNTSAGIVVDNADGSVIHGNYIGVDISGNSALPNGTAGVSVEASSNVRIGGSGVGEGNLVSGNLGLGVDICCDPSANVNFVEGNLIGTNAAGSAAIPNGLGGVRIFGGHENIIGGTDLGARNIISGNDGPGVHIVEPDATFNTVLGNYIGTDASGSLAIPNSGSGVRIDDSSDNSIGAPDPGAGNVISGNDVGGVLLLLGASGNQVQGNLIGVAADGTTAIGNRGPGVRANSSEPNTIGGDSSDAGNLIAHNIGAGVEVDDTILPTRNKRISQNSIHSNGGPGIDLNADGVTLNDNMDPDGAANDSQNYPVLSSAETNGVTAIKGTLNSLPNTGFELQFFANDQCDPTGFGEGQTYLGSKIVNTDGVGDASFQVDVAGAAAGQLITATAIDPEDNTSEFSLCIEAISVATPTPSPTPTPTPLAGVHGDTDCDLDVDSIDALWILREVAGFDPDVGCLAQGDVQCDGDRDSIDALGVLRHVAGLPPIDQQPGCPAVGDPVA